MAGTKQGLLEPALQMKTSPYKDYLGDGVYADFDRGVIVLTTENGIEVQNTIYMEPEVLAALDRYRNWLPLKIAQVEEQQKAQANNLQAGTSGP